MFLWCELILFCGRGGEEERENVISAESQGGEVPLLGNLCWLLPPLSWPFLSFFLWWPIVAQEADGILILAHSCWGVKCGALFPLAMKEQIPWPQYTTVGKRRLHMTSKTLFLFFQTKIVEEDASSQLSQSTGIYIVQDTWFQFEGAGQATNGQRAGKE